MPTNQEKPSQKQRNSGFYARYAGMGTQMLIIIALGVGAGIWLDKHVLHPGAFPVFTIVLSLFSVVVAIYFVVKDLLKK